MLPFPWSEKLELDLGYRLMWLLACDFQMLELAIYGNPGLPGPLMISARAHWGAFGCIAFIESLYIYRTALAGI